MSKVRNAKLEMEGYRIMMRKARDVKEHAMYKRDFRAARNRYYQALKELRESVRRPDEIRQRP